MSHFLSFGFIAPLLTPVIPAEAAIINGTLYEAKSPLRINNEGTLVYCDCGELDFHHGDHLVVSSPNHLRKFASELAKYNLVITSQVSFFSCCWNLEGKTMSKYTLVEFLENLKATPL